MKATTGMKKIEALIAKSDIQAVEERLEALGIDSVSITPVVDHGKGNILYYRGAAYRPDSYKFKLECLVTDQLVPSAIETIAKTAGPCVYGGYSTVCVFDVADMSLSRRR